MNFFSGNYYFIIIGLQAICAIHCVKKGNQTKWLWIIVCLPVVGCLIYFFSEIFTTRQIQEVQSGVGSMLNPVGNTKRLEEQLKFSDTFHNRVALADAYLATGQTEKAIDLYEGSLTGVFTENEHVLSQLIIAYYKVQRDEDIIPIAQKLKGLPQFTRSQAHMLYAIALGNVGKTDLAEKEFKSMCSRFAYFGQRYQYGLFLIKNNREEEAENLFAEILNEADHLSSRERRANRQWFSLTKDALRNMKRTA